jgi:hypothetical protein
MELDLNLPGDFTQDGVRRLLATGPARPDRIVVCRDGMAALASASPRCERIAFVIELDERAGAGRDAPDALARRLFSCLRNNWPVPRDVYL